MPNAPYSLQARYVFPVGGPPIDGGVVTIEGPRIVAVGENALGARPRDLGNVAIVPGLVNAHTHLEFSRLDSPLGRSGMPFPDWIREVIAWRDSSAEADDGEAESANAVARGLRQSLVHGVTSIGEIAKPDWPAQPFAESPLAATVFVELLGLAKEREAALLKDLDEHIAPSGEHPRRGVSPHAPYTVSAGLLQKVAQISAEQKFPLAMHLAESPEEMELLGSGSGPLVDLLEELGAWHPAAVARDARPLDYLQYLAAADRSLVIHGNYLDDAEIDFVTGRAERMAVVYCPRTHAYFGHDRYPLAKMIQRGACVALGTDSRASSPDLDMLAEMCHVAEHHSDVLPADVLAMGTLAGARALGIGDRAGTIESGKRADLTIIELPDRAAADAHELLFDPASRVVATVIGGELVYGPSES